MAGPKEMEGKNVSHLDKTHAKVGEESKTKPKVEESKKEVLTKDSNVDKKEHVAANDATKLSNSKDEKMAGKQNMWDLEQQINKGISFTMPSSHPHLGGQTFHGGRPTTMPNGKAGVYFGEQKIAGKKQPLYVGTADKPDLAKSAEEHEKLVAKKEEMQRLPRERASLVQKYDSAVQNAEYHQKREWESGNEAEAFNGKKQHEVKIEAARKELAEFDRNHPEIRNEIESESIKNAHSILSN